MGMIGQQTDCTYMWNSALLSRWTDYLKKNRNNKAWQRINPCRLLFHGIMINVTIFQASKRSLNGIRANEGQATFFWGTGKECSKSRELDTRVQSSSSELWQVESFTKVWRLKPSRRFGLILNKQVSCSLFFLWWKSVSLSHNDEKPELQLVRFRLITVF